MKNVDVGLLGMVARVLDPKAPTTTIDERAAAFAFRPAKATLQTITTATLLFYAAERGHNPGVNSVWDALTYVTTCLSVGYHNVFPVTPTGKIIASALMTIGPALSSQALDGPHGDKPSDAVEREILSTLKEILARLPAPSADGPVETDEVRSPS